MFRRRKRLRAFLILRVLGAGAGVGWGRAVRCFCQRGDVRGHLSFFLEKDSRLEELHSR